LLLARRVRLGAAGLEARGRPRRVQAQGGAAAEPQGERACAKDAGLCGEPLLERLVGTEPGDFPAEIRECDTAAEQTQRDGAALEDVVGGNLRVPRLRGQGREQAEQDDSTGAQRPST